MNNITKIVTDRLTLRSPVSDDADFYTDLENNEKVKKYVGGRSGITVERYRLNIIANQKKALSVLTVIKRDSGTIIGRAGILEINNQEIEVHCVIAEEFWGQGFGFEIVNSLIRHSKQIFPGKLIVGNVNPDNVACIRIIEHLGFRENGIIHSDGFDNGFRKYIRE